MTRHMTIDNNWEKSGPDIWVLDNVLLNLYNFTLVDIDTITKMIP